MPPTGFIPVLTRRPLDHLLSPFLPRLAQAALVSVPELPFIHRPDLPLMVDSGGFLAFHPQAQVQERDGLGILTLGDVTLTPQSVHDAQRQAQAAVSFTLDFPSPATLSATERQRRTQLSLANARWAAAQPRASSLYAVHQPGMNLADLLELGVDGLALGGLAPLAKHPEKLAQAVTQARAALPSGFPLHVLGIGNLDAVRACLHAGATSLDASTPQRLAASGRNLSGTRWTDPSPAERMNLALDSLVELKTLSQEFQEDPVGTGGRPSDLPAFPASDHQLLTLPTGGGKTTRARERARTHLHAGGKVLLLVPLRALVSEVALDWAEQLPGHRVVAYTRDQRRPQPYRQADVLIMTPERLDLLTRQWRRHHPWLARLTLVITDELHLLSDPQRGAALDAALSRLRMINPLAERWALTATCGNPAEVSAWLGAGHVQGGDRPVPLTWKLLPVKDQAGKRAVLRGLLHPQERTLIFLHSRQRADELAATLRTWGVGALSHHAGLTSAARSEVERAYRAREVRVLTCTPTLELGVNLGADHVILHDLSFTGGKRAQPITVTSAWQRAGRAGREAGSLGKVSLLVTPWENGEAYLQPNFEPLSSPLLSGVHPLGYLIGSLDAGLIRTPSQAQRALRATFAAQGRRVSAQAALGSLQQVGAVEVIGEALRVTALGRVASRHLLDPQSVRDAQRLPEDPTAFDVLLLAALTLRLTASTGWQPLLEALKRRLPSRLLDRSGPAFTFPEQNAALSRACLHWQALHTSDLEAAAHSGVYPGTLQTEREALTRLVLAWAEYTQHPKVRLCARMLACGVSLEEATLTLLSGVGRATVLKLRAADVHHLEDLAQTSVEALTKAGLTPRRAQQLIHSAQDALPHLDGDPAREPPPSQARCLSGQAHDPLRLLRSAALNVTATPNGFQVTGGSQAHQVTLEPEWCDCPDHPRTGRCKHLLAVLRSTGKAEVVKDLKDMGIGF